MITVVVPYYRQPLMLKAQLETWARYDDEARTRLKFIVVDDGSPEPAEPIIRESGLEVDLYRIDKDIPWNRGGARNLGSKMCDTEWLVHLDTDHVLPPDAAKALVEFEPDPDYWYRFPRWRVGAADETRRKDDLPTDCVFGEIKPHIDSYLCRTSHYWRVGGYDEDYSGILGGGSPFLAQLSQAAPMAMLPKPICLHVHTRHSVPDASISTLSRDTSKYAALRKQKEAAKKTRPTNPIRFEWSRVL